MTTIPTYHRGSRNFGTGYDMMHYIEELEEQMAEAEAVLQGIVDLGGTMGSALYAETVDRAVRATLAELKGQDDE